MISVFLANLSIHSSGISFGYNIPAILPVIAPIVSVSSPKLTAFKTASLKLSVFKILQMLDHAMLKILHSYQPNRIL